MRYQVVVQFADVKPGDFDRLVLWEEALAARLPASAEDDGHDFGSGEFNIFILTDDPVSAFRDVRKFFASHPLELPMYAVYRELGGDDFVVLWPPGGEDFDIA